MSTTPALFAGLIDDAAVFPPGNAPLGEAVTHHFAHRQAPYAALVGPLLVPASAAGALVELLTSSPPQEPLRVGVIGRPGTDPALVLDAVVRLCATDDVAVSGAEIGWYDGWYDTLAGRLPLAVEIPRGGSSDLAIAQVRSAHREGFPVVAKFRTGPTATWAWPDEQELAEFLAIVAREMPFKLTGGLHHVVRGTHAMAGVPEENHGLLNVLVATGSALEGASVAEVAGLLAIRDAEALAGLVSAWTADTTRRVRQSFTAYGCCEVRDPITELAQLDLLPPDHLPGGRP